MGDQEAVYQFDDIRGVQQCRLDKDSSSKSSAFRFRMCDMPVEDDPEDFQFYDRARFGRGPKQDGHARFGNIEQFSAHL